MITRSRDGFTLIEVLIALVILSLALAATMPSLVHTVKGNTFADDTTLAATYAQDKLEELRRKDFSELVAECNLGNRTETAPNDDSAFELHWKVQNADGTTGCGSSIFVIEACAATDARIGEICFPTATSALPAAHFLAVRANF